MPVLPVWVAPASFFLLHLLRNDIVVFGKNNEIWWKERENIQVFSIFAPNMRKVFAIQKVKYI